LKEAFELVLEGNRILAQEAISDEEVIREGIEIPESPRNETARAAAPFAAARV
jgi:hypothetical protein